MIIIFLNSEKKEWIIKWINQNLKYFSKSLPVYGQIVLLFIQVWCANTPFGYITKTYLIY